MTLVVLESVTSTMDAAREMLQHGQVSVDDLGNAEPGGILALDQTAGRGQRGRTWYSAPGESLCSTFFLPLSEEDFRQAGKVAILAGAAIATALHDMFPGDLLVTSPIDSSADYGRAPKSPSSQFGLKWPNDLLLTGKKVGGILVEVVSDPKIGAIALVGVGINVEVRHFPPEIEPICTSLALHGLVPESLQTLGDRIRESLSRITAIQLQEGFGATLACWRRFDQTTGRRFRTETEDSVKTGIAIGVDADGALVLRTDYGTEVTVISASATSEMRRPYPGSK